MGIPLGAARDFPLRGRPDPMTVGEKGSYFYVAFGAPKAHEDDPWRAVNAALELHTPPKRLDYIDQVQVVFPWAQCVPAHMAEKPAVLTDRWATK